VRYLVTGGAGFIGSALVRRLLADGHEVVVLDNFSRGREGRLRDAGCEFYHGDIRNPAVVNNAVQGCDSVIHLAYLQGTATFYIEPRQVLDVAIRGMVNVLAACEAAGVTDLLLMSSSEAYQTASVVPTPETVPLTVPDPLNPRYSYGGGKIACEIMANAWARTGVLDRVIIARPHNIIGPDMGREHVVPEFCLRMNHLAREHPEGIIPFPVQGTGAETRSFCYVDDCVDQLALLLAKVPDGQHVYHVGNMDERTIAGVAHEVAACYGREIKVVPGTLPKGSPPRRLPDTSKLCALVPGYLPLVNFAEAVKRTVAWYRENG
jgi:nucleoside-diphosphate-sugar epimerase